MIDVDTLLAEPNFAPKAWQSAAPSIGGWSKPPVLDSPDLRRVLALPRREVIRPRTDTSEALIEYMTERYRNKRTGACQCAMIGIETNGIPRECITRLRHVQAWALYEIGIVGGLLGPIGVGHGKTMLDVLAPLALKNCRLAVVLVKPTLIDQLITEYRLISQHWRVPQLVVHGRDFASSRNNEGVVLHVLSYARLSRANATTFMSSLSPDTILSDEIQYLRHPDTATTGRVLRHFAAHPRTRFLGWTGSMTEDSIGDYAHLSAMALRNGSPVPLDPEVVKDWSRALDSSELPAPGGALFKLCEPGEHVREGFRRRLVETQGVVSAYEPAIDAVLKITEREAPPIPTAVADALDVLESDWVRPDGEEVADPLAKLRCAIQLACGFYYRWIFPRGEDLPTRVEWLTARKEWNRELRKKLLSRVEHLDSPMLCAQAAIRGWSDGHRFVDDGKGRCVTDDDGIERRMRGHCVECGGYYSAHLDSDLPSWKPNTWPRWITAKPTVQPETEPVRLDDYLARDAAQWAHDNRGIVWYTHGAFGEWVAEISGLPLHGGGQGAGKRIAAERGDRSIIASIKSHGTGRDGLQKLFATQLVANPSSSAKTWEQLLGRLYREGQKAVLVTAAFYCHTPDLQRCVATALRRARYIADTTGAEQKIHAAME